MRVRSLWVSLLVALSCLLAWPAIADDGVPKIVHTSPENGATDVPLDLGTIRIVFDRNMKMNTWTLWQSEQGAFPELAGEAAIGWRDPRTLEVRIGTLQPQTTYAIQLNSDTRQGFQTAEDQVPLPITVLTFTTAARDPGPPAPPVLPQETAPEPEEPADQDAPLDGSEPDAPEDDTATRPVTDGYLLGAWAWTDPETQRRRVLRVWLTENEWEECEVGADGRPEAVLPPGQWELADDVLLVRRRRGLTTQVSRYALRRDGEDGLALRRIDELDAPWRTYRPLNDLEADVLLDPELAARVERLKEILVGVWTLENEENDTTATYDLKADGTFVLDGRRGEETARFVGTWSVKGCVVAFVGEGETDPLELVARPVDDDHVDIAAADGDGTVRQLTRLERKDASPPAPEGTLVGRWVLEEAGARLELTLEADGRFTHRFTQDGETEVTTGTWREEEGRLVATMEDGEVLTVGARLLDADRLELDEDGEKTVLLRHGTKVDPPPPPPVGPLSEEAKKVVGHWRMRNEQMDLQIDLEADGTFVETSTVGGQTSVTRGTWNVEKGVLVATPKPPDPVVRLNCRLVDAETLELLDDEGNGVRMKRQ